VSDGDDDEGGVGDGESGDGDGGSGDSENGSKDLNHMDKGVCLVAGAGGRPGSECGKAVL
jgi:hypothetical protein